VAWQVAGIGALVLCFIFATPLSSVVAPSIPLEAPLNRWVAMLGIYLFFSFATFAVARGFREILEKAHFQEFDKHLGAIFGVLKGALLTLVFTFFIVAMSEKARAYVLTTYTGHFCAIIMDRLNPVMPTELHAILEPYIHSLDEAAEGKLKHKHAPGDLAKRAAGEKDEFDEDDWKEDQANSRDLRNSFPDDDDRGGDLLGKAIGETARKVGKELLEEADDFVFGKNKPGTAARTGTSGYRPLEGGEEDSPIEPKVQPTGQTKYRYRPEQYEPLIQEMSREWARMNKIREDQARYDLEVMMKGLPKSVGAAVLHDLRADLYQDEEDPDPTTNSRTPFPERVKRQIKGTGVPRDRLTQTMRERLDELDQ
ncbi:MAG: CvpA family protein, partial [Planctomycetaceae bacterium]|nr:CvpA family protein [Planctomycetaceae bacterium]